MLDLALDNRVFLNTELDCALQEIDMLLNTENTELLGYPEYGTEFETFLWSLTPSQSDIEQYITGKLSECYFLRKFDYQVNCELYSGNFRNIYEINIIVTNVNTQEVGTRKYRYQ